MTSECTARAWPVAIRSVFSPPQTSHSVTPPDFGRTTLRAVLRPDPSRREEVCGVLEKAEIPHLLLQIFGNHKAPTTSNNRMSPHNLLQGKTAAVTGGATGIGRAIAIEFHRQGANVAINHLPGQDAEIESLQKEIPNLLAVPGDISLPETSVIFVSKIVERFGELNIFVSNAGICQFSKFLDVSPELYRRHVSINLDGAFYSTQAAGRQMRDQGKGGSIIGISSISALVGGGEQAHYCPTKAGILSLMQSEAVALGPHGIRCNALLPGTIRTQLNDEDLSDEGKRVYMEGRIPLGRLGVPSDMAGPAVFLASDLSQYVTGSQMLVDGGAFVNFQ